MCELLVKCFSVADYPINYLLPVSMWGQVQQWPISTEIMRSETLHKQLFYGHFVMHVPNVTHVPNIYLTSHMYLTSHKLLVLFCLCF